jgi:hypothetical protein
MSCLQHLQQEKVVSRILKNENEKGTKEGGKEK